jgi:hypothetical protein
MFAGTIRQMASPRSASTHDSRFSIIAISHQSGIPRMGSSLIASVLEFGVFDKAEPSRRAPPERRIADDRPKPMF